MCAYKFLIIDESDHRNLLPQMKKDFEVKKIYRITFETVEISGFPKIDWHEFKQNHAYLYGQLINVRRHDQIALYLFTANPQNLMWSLKNTNSNHRFFEIDSDIFLNHVDAVKKLAEIEKSFSEVKSDFEGAEFNLESSITDDHGSYLGIAEELESLHAQARSAVALARNFENQCLSHYSQISLQPWS